MITTKFNQEAIKERKFEFPHLFENNAYGSIILFNSETSGTILQSGCKTHIVGEYCDSWVSCWDKGIWTPLKSGESIILTVE